MDKKDVLRYLGYKNQVIDESMDDLIDKHMKSLASYSGRIIYKVFDFKVDQDVHVLDTVLTLPGQSVKHMLSQANKLVLFVATLGPEVDQLIHKYSYVSGTDMLILDACASVKIEDVLDQMEEEIQGYKTPRFSPGYGDLPLSVQANIISVLEGRRIGVTVSESSLLLPKKTVTGFIGLSHEPMTVTYKFCDDCLKRTSCDFKICNRE